MGEVWRARDSKLGRDVALKLLPEDFAADSDRHSRFEREAKVLASLNHPNIATLLGLEHLDGRHVLVMELVEGEGLDERIVRGRIPFREAVPIALQIAQALEAAHEKGIVHRDLKPANVRIRPDGTVKVLDFGLAKAWETMEGVELSHSPTITRANTAAGVILGTASYMSPEQARGQAVDTRADIWAFGVVLWEMLTGHRLFQEDTVSDTLAAVLREQVDLAELPADTPRAIRRLLRRCLARDPRARLHAIADARLELDEALTPETADAEPHAAVVEVRRPWLWLACTAALGLCVAVLGLLAWRLATREAPVVRAAIPAPAGTVFNLPGTSPGPVAVSPDGRRVAFAARDTKGVVLLWVRDLRDVAARPLAGTEDAAYPFWSPDSRKLGFFSGTKLKKVDADGGPPLTLCDASNGKGGTWNRDGDIVFAPTHASPLHRVSAAGGDSTPVTTLDDQRGETSHRHPRFLADGQHVLFLARVAASGSAAEKNRIMIGSLDGGVPEELMRGFSNTEVAAGHALFVREGTLMAQPFDVPRRTLRGEPFPLAEQVTFDRGASLGVFSASAGGILVYQTGDQSNEATLSWRGADGEQQGILGEPAGYQEVHLSPDGTRAAVAIVDPESGGNDIWIWDVQRGIKTRFTFTAEDDGAIAFSPDGTQLVFGSERDGHYNLYVKDLEGSAEERLLYKDDLDKYPTGWSPDGRSIVYTTFDRRQWDIWVLPLAEGSKPARIQPTEFNEQMPQVSPDGRWLAYGSDESGRMEVYVTAFPAGGRKWQVSDAGGNFPRWHRGGQALFYVSNTSAYLEADVDGGGAAFRVGKLRKLFDGPPPQGPYGYDVTADAGRFLTVNTTAPEALPPLTLVVNWPSGIDQR